MHEGWDTRWSPMMCIVEIVSHHVPRDSMTMGMKLTPVGKLLELRGLG